MAVHLTSHRSGFGVGLTAITGIEEADDDTGIALSVLVLERGGRFAEDVGREKAWLLMSGDAVIEVDGRRHEVHRGSLFDDLPYCVHSGKGAKITIEAQTALELMLFETANARPFPAAVYGPSDIRNEPRGKGQVKEAAFRFVRTIFDPTNADPRADLVLGEVINLPGRWSSFPPHHHPQPEIYHYRFTSPGGWGHAELGETVLKVRHNDTLKILEGRNHPQCAAPGYGMYYAWVIRHLPGQRYDVPEFEREHAWIMKSESAEWWPRGVEDD